MAYLVSMAPRPGVDQRVVPPLPPEHFICEACGVSYATLEVGDAVRRLAAIPTDARAATAAVPEPLLRRRPDAHTWSVLEYACHLRDVYATYTIRLHRARTEDRPIVEPMLNDLRARRFRHNERDLRAVLDELSANVAGFGEEIARVRAHQWDRTVTRLPGEERTARWLVRQASHEGTHHVRDIQGVAARVAHAAGDPL